MTLIRRAKRPFPCEDVGSDIENSLGASCLTPLWSSSSSYTIKAKSIGWFSTWSSLQWQRIRYRPCFKTSGINGSKKYCGISALGLCVVLTIFVVVVTISTASHFASPGKNYLNAKYWRRSHSISSQKMRDLRHRFPIHIDTNSTDEMESIVHPGDLLADKKRMEYISGEHFEVQNMTVPKFWDPDDAFGEYEGGVREFLGDRGKYLITPTEASAIGSFYDEKRTIFIAIASYRDPECPSTVESVFARAKYPERLRVAIIDQQKEGQTDTSCRPPSESLCHKSPNNILCGYINQIDHIEYSSILMVGPIFARHLGNRMYRGEYFAMQIDSHVRFVSNWDEDIIDQWNSTGNEMAVISTYMTDIGYNNIDPKTHVSRVKPRSIMCNFEYEWNPGAMAHIKFNKQPLNTPKVKDSPMLHPFWAAGFSFGRGHFLV